MLRYKTKITWFSRVVRHPARNGAGLFLQPWSPHGAESCNEYAHELGCLDHSREYLTISSDNFYGTLRGWRILTNFIISKNPKISLWSFSAQFSSCRAKSVRSVGILSILGDWSLYMYLLKYRLSGWFCTILADIYSFSYWFYSLVLFIYFLLSCVSNFVLVTMHCMHYIHVLCKGRL